MKNNKETQIENLTIRIENSVKSKETKLDKFIKITSLVLAFVSLIISCVSFNVSCALQKEANLFTQTMSALNIDIEIIGKPVAVYFLKTKYILSPFIISKKKSELSGDYKNFCFVTVKNNRLDTFTVQDNKYKDSKDELGKIFSNGTTIILCTENLINQQAIENLKGITGDEDIEQKLRDNNNLSFLFSLPPESSYSIFHIILNGYNGDKALYSFVCNYKENNVASDDEMLTSEINCIMFDDENLYDWARISNFIDNNKSLKLSSDKLFDIVEKERNLIKAKLS